MLPNLHSNTAHVQCHPMFFGRGVNDREIWHVKYLLVWCHYLLVTGKTEPPQHYGKFAWKNLKIFEWAPFRGFPQ